MYHVRTPLSRVLVVFPVRVFMLFGQKFMALGAHDRRKGAVFQNDNDSLPAFLLLRRLGKPRRLLRVLHRLVLCTLSLSLSFSTVVCKHIFIAGTQTFVLSICIFMIVLFAWSRYIKKKQILAQQPSQLPASSISLSQSGERDGDTTSACQP